MRATRWAHALAALGIAAALLGGCGKKKSVLRPDLTPETTVFVQFTPGSGHDVNHLVHLYWFGTDPDGDVVGYDLRFVYPGEDPDTVAWHRTASRDSVFAVYTPTGLSTPTFYVRAIDNAGLVDPSPAFQQFNFTNQPPVLSLARRKLTDTTFASVTLSWSATDPDGDPGKMRFRVWMDGNAANPTQVSTNTYTVPTAAFRDGAGHLGSGYRTAFVQPIDDGGMLGVYDSTTWYVRAPVPGADRGRLLLIDDITGKVGNAFTYDTLYENTAQRNLASTDYSILRLSFTQPFLSSADVAQTFALFDAVVWYRGPQTALSTVLQNYWDGVEAYLNADGRFMLESLDPFAGHRAQGSLPESFVSDHLGSDYMYGAPLTGEADTTVSWTLNNIRILRSFQPADVDSLRSLITMTGVRGFAVRDTHDVVLWAPSGTLSPANPVPLPVAVSVPRVRGNPGGGRFTVTSVSLRACHGAPPYNNAHKVLANLFKLMGLAP